MTDVSVEIRDLKKYYPLNPKKGFSVFDLPDIIRNRNVNDDSVIKVLDGIDLDIKKGECFGIVGPNGTGKSTLLRLIAGIIPPDSGTVTIRGSLIPLLSLNVGFSNELNAHDNIYQYGIILGFSKKEMDAMYDDIIAFSGLERYQYMRLKNFSSGMRVKLGFSTAVKINPDILVLDEILAVGDMSFREKSQQKILDFCTSDRTVVIVSHSMNTITTLCDRALFLKDGKIGRIGDPDDVISAYMEAMHGKIPPKDLIFAHGRMANRKITEYDRNHVHRTFQQISNLQLISLIRECYESRVEDPLYAYLTLQNLKKMSHMDDVLAQIGDGTPDDEWTVGYSGISFIKKLGEKKPSHILASRLIKNLFNDGFIHFGNDALDNFFSEKETKSPLSGHISTILIRDGSRSIPVLVEKEKIGIFSSTFADQILESVHGDDCTIITFVLPPELFTEKAIPILKQKKIGLLLPVPVQIIQEKRDLQDFLEDIASPERMEEFIDSPLFVKNGKFSVQGHEIDGYGYFNPRYVLKEYSYFYKKLVAAKCLPEGTGHITPRKVDSVIKKNSRKKPSYFSEIHKGEFSEAGYNVDMVRARQKLIGTTFLYHSGNWDAIECYRNFERWRLTNDAFSLYSKIVLSPDAVSRGKALITLINTAIWSGNI